MYVWLFLKFWQHCLTSSFLYLVNFDIVKNMPRIDQFQHRHLITYCRDCALSSVSVPSPHMLDLPHGTRFPENMCANQDYEVFRKQLKTLFYFSFKCLLIVRFYTVFI